MNLPFDTLVIYIVGALFFIVSVCTALGYNPMSLAFKFIAAVVSLYTVVQQYSILVDGWHAYQEGKDTFLQFASRLYDRNKYELSIIMAGYFLFGIFIIQELVERFSLHKLFKFLKKNVVTSVKE